MNADPFSRALELTQSQMLGERLNISLKKIRPVINELFNANQKSLNAKIKRSYPKSELVG